ncbi:uncharacterized protein LOC117528897 [Thalassophryne amazonica]|uniref:uncharacterized protein LOC117528897 n=1 Tax=Thalassophryne amazonica TaxID=390379 RepID=UPI0014712ED0|nr:uncharacterized protein LOC117528897 [Thalassophryne amazonica]
MAKERAQVFTPVEQELLLEGYEEFTEMIHAKGNTAKAAKTRKEGWQKVADKLNTINTSTPRTWEQVKVKYKNIRQTANRKKAELKKTWGGPVGSDITTDEELIVHQHIQRPILEPIEGGTSSSETMTRCSSGDFISVTGNMVSLLPVPEQRDDDTGDVVDEETVLDYLSGEEEATVGAHKTSTTQSASSQNRGREENVHAVYKRNLLQKMEYRSLKMKKLKQDMEVDELRKEKLQLQIHLLQKELAERQ